MRDDKGGSDKGALFAVLIAVPAMVVCCGGGGLLLAGAAGLFGALGGWLTGLGGIATALAALGAVLLVREIRRHRAANAEGSQDETCCFPNTKVAPGPADIGHR